MADPKVEWRKYGSYSGPLIRNNVVIPTPVPPRNLFHIDRAYWLTTKVETGGTFGTVQAYDGCGMTAGPDQHIAVYPSELAHEDFNASDDQGTLWPLVRRLETVAGSAAFLDAVQVMTRKLDASNLYLGQDGVVRYRAPATLLIAGRSIAVAAGAVAHGAYIRNLLTPSNGVVPQTGPQWEQASSWALAFYRLFSLPDGYKAQVEFGKEDLIHRTKTLKVKNTILTIETGVYQQEITNTRLGFNGWIDAVDLAMAVYQSHSVNAPSIAATCLSNVCAGSKPVLNAAFATVLLQQLGRSTYGQWSFTDPNGRYQRTRNAAMACGLWGTSLFEGPSAVMPKAP